MSGAVHVVGDHAHVMTHVMIHVVTHAMTHAMTHVMTSFVHPRQGSPARRLLHRLESSDSNHLQIPLAVIQARQPQLENQFRPNVTIV